MPDFPNELVEAAAKALHDFSTDPETVGGGYEGRARAVLAAVLPLIEQRVKDAADLLASSTAEKLASPRKHSASASDPMPLCDCEFCARPLRDHDEEESG